MVKSKLWFLQIKPVEPQCHDYHISAVRIVNLLAHLGKIILVDWSEDVWFIEIYVFPIPNEPIHRLQQQLVPFIVLRLIVQLFPEFIILVVLKYTSRGKILP